MPHLKIWSEVPQWNVWLFPFCAAGRTAQILQDGARPWITLPYLQASPGVSGTLLLFLQLSWVPRNAAYDLHRHFMGKTGLQFTFIYLCYLRGINTKKMFFSLTQVYVIMNTCKKLGWVLKVACKLWKRIFNFRNLSLVFLSCDTFISSIRNCSCSSCVVIGYQQKCLDISVMFEMS